MSNCDHSLDTLRYANRVEKSNIDRGERASSVIEIKIPEKMKQEEI